MKIAALAVAAAALAVPATALGQSSLGIGDVTVARHAHHGVVRGTAQVSPAGVAVVVTVKSHGHAVGHATVTSGAGETPFVVHLSRRARSSLQRHHHLDVDVEVAASGPGTSVGGATSQRIVP